MKHLDAKQMMEILSAFSNVVPTDTVIDMYYDITGKGEHVFIFEEKKAKLSEE